MGAFISKQPNGLYCRFSTVTDCPTNWNMTEDEYIELCKEKAEEDAKEVLKNNIKPFLWVVEYFSPNNMSKEEFQKALMEMESDVIRITKESDNKKLNGLKEQIAFAKRNIKSENSDYLTGYISALSAVEGMIAEMEGENDKTRDSD